MVQAFQLAEHKLAGLLTEHMYAHGFEWIEAMHQFRKTTPYGFKCFILSTTVYDDLSICEFHAGIRFDQLESIAFPYTNGLKGFSAHSMSLVTSLAKLKGERFERFEVRSIEDIYKLNRNAWSDFVKTARPFFKAHDNLIALDRLFNDTPTQTLKWVNNNIDRCFRGLVIAHVINNPNFNKLKEIYREELIKANAPESTSLKYEELANFLDSYIAN